MSKHLPVGGSTATRTLNCPGWLKLRSRHNPVNRSNKYADEGNLLHDVMEEFYQTGKTFDEQVGVTTFAGQIFGDEPHHMELVKEAHRQTEEVLNTHNISLYMCEPFVQLIPDRVGGSIDMLGVDKARTTAIVLDYKFGKVKVKVEGNDQLKFYGMCAIEDPYTEAVVEGIDKFISVVIQPRCFDEPQYSINTRAELDTFKDTLLHAIEQDNLRLGSWCQWCPCAPYCPEKKKQAAAALTMSKTSASPIGQAWQMAQELKSWIADVEREAEAQLHLGSDIPLLKLIPGAKKKVHAASEDEIAKRLGEDAYERKLKTPATLVKEFGDKVDDLVTFAHNKPRVVHATHPTEAISAKNSDDPLQKALAKKPSST